GPSLANTCSRPYRARPRIRPGDTPTGVFGPPDLSKPKIIDVPWTAMATKTGKLTDTTVTYIASGVLAFLILLLAAKAGWTLWVIVPVGVLVGLYLVHSPRRQRRLAAPPARAIKPPRAAGLPTRDDRRTGW